MKKKKKINWVIVVVLLLVVVKGISLLGEYKEKEEEFVIKLGIDEDFPNEDEGTAVINVRVFMENILADFNKIPKHIVLIESKTIEGLTLRYNVIESAIEGGLPLMKSDEIIFLDDSMHQVTYTFKKDGEQKIFFDGKEVASSRFYPRPGILSGAVVVDVKEYDIKTIELDGNVEMYGSQIR